MLPYRLTPSPAKSMLARNDRQTSTGTRSLHSDGTDPYPPARIQRPRGQQPRGHLPVTSDVNRMLMKHLSSHSGGPVTPVVQSHRIPSHTDYPVTPREPRQAQRSPDQRSPDQRSPVQHDRLIRPSHSRAKPSLGKPVPLETAHGVPNRKDRRCGCLRKQGIWRRVRTNSAWLQCMINVTTTKTQPWPANHLTPSKRAEKRPRHRTPRMEDENTP